MTTFTERDVARLFARVTVDDATQCWNYPTYGDRNTYGAILIGGRPSNGGKIWKTHRMMYMLLIGPIPDGHHLHHMCENPACCNPLHLMPTDPGAHVLILHDNNVAAIHMRQTHCLNGHRLSTDNLTPRLLAKGERECIICRRERYNAWYAAHREQVRAEHRAYYRSRLRGLRQARRGAA